MSGYVEVNVVGGCRAFICASDFAGVITPSGVNGSDMASTENPITILMKSGSVVEGIHGISPNRLIVYMEGVKLLLKRSSRDMMVCYIDARDEFEADLHLAVSGDEDG